MAGDRVWRARPDLGADGVMTDQIVLLRDILTERGQWHPRVGFNERPVLTEPSS